MNIPQSIDTNNPPTSNISRWVWRCTESSIAAGQISLLSVLETFCALALYGWLALYFQHQWWLLVSALAAPIILLRSPESKTLGLKWLSIYWKKREKQNQDTTKIEKTFVYISLIITLVFFVWLSTKWLPGHQGWELFLRFFTLSMFGAAMTAAILGSTWVLVEETDVIAIIGVLIFLGIFLIAGFIRNVNYVGWVILIIILFLNLLAIKFSSDSKSIILGTTTIVFSALLVEI